MFGEKRKCFVRVVLLSIKSKPETSIRRLIIVCSNTMIMLACPVSPLDQLCQLGGSNQLSAFSKEPFSIASASVLAKPLLATIVHDSPLTQLSN